MIRAQTILLLTKTMQGVVIIRAYLLTENGATNINQTIHNVFIKHKKDDFVCPIELFPRNPHIQDDETGSIGDSTPYFSNDNEINQNSFTIYILKDNESCDVCENCHHKDFFAK